MLAGLVVTTQIKTLLHSPVCAPVAGPAHVGVTEQSAVLAQARQPRLGSLRTNVLLKYNICHRCVVSAVSRTTSGSRAQGAGPPRRYVQSLGATSRLRL
jgi:hypothetical protein